MGTQGSRPRPVSAYMAIIVAMLIALPCAQAVWPKPEAVSPPPEQRTLCLSRHLEWKAVGYTSDILEAGFERYTEILRRMPLGLGMEERQPEPGAAAADDGDGDASSSLDKRRRRKKKRCHVVHTVEVSVTSSDQSLTLETRESYSLEVASPAAMIQANSVYGALRAMETLAQLTRRRALRAAASDGDDAEDAGSHFGASQRDGQLLAEDEVPVEAVWPADGEEPAGRGKKQHKTVLLVEETDIYDAPRFRYRGLLLDTARHFLPVSTIKAHLDAMTMVKMNCLHWHLTDDESFPWQSEELPELSARGAFAPEAVYTAADIKDVVEYARFRGIRVIPELDTPGHTQSWGKSYPSLLTECYNTAADEGGEKSGRLGPINPARNESYGFMWRLIREVSRHFPDPYLHLGGDEVDHACWKSNPEVQEFMEAKGFGSDYSKLEGYWMEQVVHLAATAGKAAIVWQEAFDQGDVLPPYTRVQVWKWWKDTKQQQQQQQGADGSSSGSEGSSSEGDAAAGLSRGGEGGVDAGLSATRRRALQGAAYQQQQQQQQQQGALGCDPGMGCAAGVDDEAWKEKLAAVTKAGYDVILSAPWYLNLGCYASQDWKQYYAADPHDFRGTTEQKDHVLGGEACAWGEYIDAVNSINRVWPRAAAVAERLWSASKAVASLADGAELADVEARLADVRCRMLSRGIAAQSMGPGFCPGELTTRM